MGSVLAWTSCFGESAIRLSTGVNFSPTASIAHNFQGALKDVSSCIMIPRKFKTTMRTLVNTILQRLRYFPAALAALLGCALGVYCDRAHSGSFSLERDLPQELAPSCIHDALRQPAVSHTLDIECLDGDQIIPRDIELTQLVGEVGPGVVHPQVHSLKPGHGLPSIAATLTLAADCPVTAGQLPLQFAVAAGISHGRPVVVNNEMGEPQIKTDRSLDGPLGGSFLAIVNEQLGEPTIGLADDPEAAGYPLELLEVAATDEAQPGHANLAIPDVIANLKILEGSPTIPSFESRITRLLFPVLYPPEEALECSIQAFQCLPREYIRHSSHAGVVVPPAGEHGRLGVVADGFFPPPVGFLAMLQEVVVDAAGDVEKVEEGLLLGGSRIEPDCRGREHASTIIDADLFVNTNLIVN